MEKNESVRERLAAWQLSPAALRPHVSKNVSVSSLLNHFLSSRAQLYGVSEAEIVRRVLANALDEALRFGSYKIPEAFLASAEGKMSAGTPLYLRRYKGHQPTVPYVAES